MEGCISTVKVERRKIRYFLIKVKLHVPQRCRNILYKAIFLIVFQKSFRIELNSILVVRYDIASTREIMTRLL